MLVLIPECTGLRGVLVVPVEVHLAEEAPAETAGVAAAEVTWAVVAALVGVLDLRPAKKHSKTCQQGNSMYQWLEILTHRA